MKYHIRISSDDTLRNIGLSVLWNYENKHSSCHEVNIRIFESIEVGSSNEIIIRGVFILLSGNGMSGRLYIADNFLKTTKK